MQAARDRQKSYADLKRKPMEFPSRDKKKVGEVAYKLELPEELSRVHNTFHVSNLKKCHADEPLAVPLDGLNLDDKLHFVEEPVEIVGREVKRLKRNLEDKARLTGEFYNTLCFRGTDDIDKSTMYVLYCTCSLEMVLAKVRAIANKLELPQELSRVHNTFHVSYLRKCYADEPLVIPLDVHHNDGKLHFVEEPVEIMDREVKRLKQNRILIVKV
ncbi:hypothetical protein Tco_1107065 [Tanacetum coccineum]